jgi:hypothetical protein
MTGRSEFNSRAELCRKLAEREPANRTIWMAEAENWLRLSEETPHRENEEEIEPGALARLRAKSTRLLFIIV